jgi:hypothetical protein
LRTPARAALAATVLTVAAFASAHATPAHASSTGFALDGPTGPGPRPTAPGPPPGPDSGRFGVRLLDVPVAEADDPRARDYIIDNLTPGTVIHRRIVISSTDHRPLPVSVYPDAAVITGGSFVSQPGHTVNDLATWTSLSQGAVIVPAYGSAIDTVTIAVPEDAAPGERYGLVQAEVQEAGPGNIALVNRVGIRMYLSVGGDNPPAADFTVDTLTAHRDAKEHPFIEAMVHNTGGRAVDMSGTLTLVKKDGSLTAGPYQVTLGTTLAPGQSEPVRTVITDAVPDGPWNATVELKSGLLDEKYQASITFPSSPGFSPAAAARPAAQPNRFGPVTGGLLALAVIGGAGIPFVLRRRKRSAGKS